MERLELNVGKIKRLTKKRENENYNFRAYLKRMNSQKVDKLVHELHRDISSQIDCMECGNCCIELRSLLTNKEIKKLSDLDNTIPSQFAENFVGIDELESRALKLIKSLTPMILHLHWLQQMLPVLPYQMAMDFGD